MEREGAELLQSPSMATPPQGQFSARLASHVRGFHLAPPNHPALASAGISQGGRPLSCLSLRLKEPYSCFVSLFLQLPTHPPIQWCHCPDN